MGINYEALLFKRLLIHLGCSACWLHILGSTGPGPEPRPWTLTEMWVLWLLSPVAGLFCKSEDCVHVVVLDVCYAYNCFAQDCSSWSCQSWTFASMCVEVCSSPQWLLSGFSSSPIMWWCLFLVRMVCFYVVCIYNLRCFCPVVVRFFFHLYVVSGRTSFDWLFSIASCYFCCVEFLTIVWECWLWHSLRLIAWAPVLCLDIMSPGWFGLCVILLTWMSSLFSWIADPVDLPPRFVF